MNKRHIAALVCALVLAVAASASASAEENGGFGTYILPEGVTVCNQDDLRYFDTPQGLESMYDLMSAGNAKADVYLFLMPNNLGVVSVARTAATGSVQALADAWPDIQQALAQEAHISGAETSMSRETAFGYDAIRVQATLSLSGDTALTAHAEGTAFYRESDLLEVWTACPDENFCKSADIPVAKLEEDSSAMNQLLASFDFGGDPDAAKRPAVLTEDATAYQDPNGAFSLMIPAKTRVITQATDEATVATYRALYADGSQGDGRVFDHWLDDVAKSDCTLMLLPEAGLAWEIFCENDDYFRTANLGTYYQLAEPVRASLETRFGSASIVKDDGSAVISGLKHAKLVYWLRADTTDVALEVYAITDESGLLREVDLYTMMDVQTDGARQESIFSMLRETLTYAVPEKMPEPETASPAAD